MDYIYYFMSCQVQPITEMLLASLCQIMTHKYFTLSQANPVFTCLQYKSFENTLGKKNSHDEQIPLFTQCFLPFLRTFFKSNLKWLSANSLILEESKICCLEKG